MKCPECGCKELLVQVPVTKTLALAARGGRVKVGGVKITQMDLVESWDATPYPKGPVFCPECGAESMLHEDNGEHTLVLVTEEDPPADDEIDDSEE